MQNFNNFLVPVCMLMGQSKWLFWHLASVQGQHS
jgi:hypothetical protein